MINTLKPSDLKSLDNGLGLFDVIWHPFVIKLDAAKC